MSISPTFVLCCAAESVCGNKKLVTRKPSAVDKAALTRKFNKEMEKMLGQICVVINTKQSLDDKINQIRGLFETLDEHNAVRLGYVRQHSDKDNNILRMYLKDVQGHALNELHDIISNYEALTDLPRKIILLMNLVALM